MDMIMANAIVIFLLLFQQNFIVAQMR